MKISIKQADGKGFKIIFPTRLLLNPIGARLMAKSVKMNGHSITPEQASALAKEINRCRKGGGWKMVEVRSADGEEVDITI